MRFLLPGFIFVFIFLLFYSYTQIDLNLFLSKYEPILSFQKFFQNIGYFQRPLSTYLYLGSLALMFTLYLLVLSLARKGKIQIKNLWKMIVIGGVILIFSYNAFSYDLFNYIFDAKIVTYYQQNPYEHKALDYIGDPMLNFMRWTHRTYPYGPGWLGVTVPLSFLGMNFFLPTALMFKALATAAYFGTAFFVYKILNKINPKNAVFGLAFFALNPLVIIESLVSAHIDIVMVFFGVMSFYYLLTKNLVKSLFSVIFSISIKFATVFLIPVWVCFIFLREKNYEKLLIASVILMSFSVMAATIRTNFQPWYLLDVLPFAALVSRKYYIFIPSVVLSFTSLLIYVPYLYTGNWDPPIPSILNWIMLSGVLLSVLLLSAKILGSGKIKI